jgi:hypothetical protein
MMTFEADAVSYVSSAVPTDPPRRQPLTARRKRVDESMAPINLKQRGGRIRPEKEAQRTLQIEPRQHWRWHPTHGGVGLCK